MKIDIYSGFLGAGKTTLIRKMIAEGYKGEKLVLIENEFGEIGIDGGFMQDAGINMMEMNSGCICCSLVGDFGKALTKVIDEYAPDRIIIEPSGVGKLSDVIAAVKKVTNEQVTLGAAVAVVDASKVKAYMKNFGEFYNDQVETATSIILSRTDSMPQAKLDAAIALLRAHNGHAALISTPWPQLSGDQLREAMEGRNSLRETLEELAHEHHHHHDDDEHECCCGHHHDEDEHHHHHDDDGHECCCGHHHDEDEHHHHHHDDDGHECCCGHHHDGDEHHHHHADEVFSSWGVETAKKFTADEVRHALQELNSGKYGAILRAKGILDAQGGWIYFDFVPDEMNIRTGSAAVIGKLCVIGSKLDETGIAGLFGV